MVHALRNGQVDFDVFQTQLLVFRACYELENLGQHVISDFMYRAAFFRGGNKYLRGNEALFFVD